MSAAFDEMAAGGGALRPHWRDLMGALWTMQPGQLAERTARARTHLAQADEILGIYGGDTRRAAWELDLLPVILPESEWTALTAGLAQRATLLDLVLRDIYGPQRLLAERALPPYLVLGNPEFLRPARRLGEAPPPAALHVYAADVVRQPDGSWRVFADRTQAPGGVGYALRHRAALARFLPEGFRNLLVRRLRPFAERWQTALYALAPDSGSQPVVVLLTPGPYNEAYFEHVYLARELGLTLARGSDLTVRDGFVFLKTLEGLVRVDVIYRRVDGAWCDPLEFRQDSTLGIAGLQQAIREGKVAVANMPGSAVIESPAFAPFLPLLARRLLGQDLLLPAVTTWWCGQREALGEVQRDLDRFFLRPVFAADPEPVEPAQLARRQRRAVQAELAARPAHFVAVERVEHGVVPTLMPDGIEPRPFILRVVLVREGDGWTAMPGGVARIAAPDSPYRGTLRHGGIAKDVWVLTAEETDVMVPEIRRETPAIRRSMGVLPSRVADDLYWLGRNIERIDAGARLFRAVLARLVGGELGPREMIELAMLASALARLGWIEGDLARAPADGRMFADGMALAASQGDAMTLALSELRRLAVSVRDRLSLDMWRNLNHMVGRAGQALVDGARDPDRLLEALDGLLRGSAAFSGLAAENMTRGASWRFLDLGRRLERSLAIADALAALLNQRPSLMDLAAGIALEYCDSTITYRTRYGIEPRCKPVVDLILLDASNPRSLVFQLDRFRGHMRALEPATAQSEDFDVAGRLTATLSDLSFLSEHDPSELAPVLGLLEEVSRRLAALSDAITRSFFSHVVPLSDAERLRQEAGA